MKKHPTFLFFLVSTLLLGNGYLLFFYASDGNEPHHIHVERDDNIAKYWLDPVRLCYSGGFNRLELKQVRRIIEENRKSFMEAWNEYFGS